jgi:hypothetical protein
MSEVSSPLAWFSRSKSLRADCWPHYSSDDESARSAPGQIQMLQHIHWHGSFPQLRKSVALTISLTRFPWTSDTAKLPSRFIQRTQLRRRRLRRQHREVPLRRATEKCSCQFELLIGAWRNTLRPSGRSDLHGA